MWELKHSDHHQLIRGNWKTKSALQKIATKNKSFKWFEYNQFFSGFKIVFSHNSISNHAWFFICMNKWTKRRKKAAKAASQRELLYISYFIFYAVNPLELWIIVAFILYRIWIFDCPVFFPIFFPPSYLFCPIPLSIASVHTHSLDWWFWIPNENKEQIIRYIR